MTASDEFDESVGVDVEEDVEEVEIVCEDNLRANAAMQYLDFYHLYTSQLCINGELHQSPGKSDKNAKATADAAFESLRVYFAGTGEIEGVEL